MRMDGGGSRVRERGAHLVSGYRHHIGFDAVAVECRVLVLVLVLVLLVWDFSPLAVFLPISSKTTLTGPRSSAMAAVAA